MHYSGMDLCPGVWTWFMSLVMHSERFVTLLLCIIEMICNNITMTIQKGRDYTLEPVKARAAIWNFLEIGHKTQVEAAPLGLSLASTIISTFVLHSVTFGRL